MIERGDARWSTGKQARTEAPAPEDAAREGRKTTTRSEEGEEILLQHTRTARESHIKKIRGHGHAIRDFASHHARAGSILNEAPLVSAVHWIAQCRDALASGRAVFCGSGGYKSSSARRQSGSRARNGASEQRSPGEKECRSRPALRRGWAARRVTAQAPAAHSRHGPLATVSP